MLHLVIALANVAVPGLLAIFFFPDEVRSCSYILGCIFGHICRTKSNSQLTSLLKYFCKKNKRNDTSGLVHEPTQQYQYHFFNSNCTNLGAAWPISRSDRVLAGPARRASQLQRLSHRPAASSSSSRSEAQHCYSRRHSREGVSLQFECWVV